MGDVSFHVFDGDEVTNHPVHSQVVAVLGHIESMTFDEAKKLVVQNMQAEGLLTDQV